MTLKEIISTLELLTKDFKPLYLYGIQSFEAFSYEEPRINWHKVWKNGDIYCYFCSKKEIKRLRELNPNRLYRGGCHPYLGNIAADDFAWCSKCNCLLNSQLTFKGASAIIEGFWLWIGDLDSNPQACWEFALVCEAIDSHTGPEKGALIGKAVAIYHRMQQMATLYRDFPPTEGLKVWIAPKPKTLELCVHVKAPYSLEEKPVTDGIFVLEISRLFGFAHEEWQFKAV